MLNRRQAIGLLSAPALPSPFRTVDELPTPALIVDLDAFEANLRKMAEHLRGAGRAFRPHAKTHKCAEIALRCQRAGAAGACAAKLSEAEALAHAGVTGLLITTPVVGQAKIRRAAALARRRPETIFSVDDASNAQQLNDAASLTRKVNVAIDLYVGRRTGVAPGAPALALAEAIQKMPNLRLQGIQAYCGYASHTEGFENRRRASIEAMQQAVDTRRLLESRGIPCPWLSGGSTGTYNIDTNLDGVTELQPGSFLFMDLDYRRIGGQGGERYDDFQPALFVVCTVISRPQPKVAIVDGGFKAFATDRGYGPEARNRPDLKYRFAGDEHGSLEMSGDDLKLGDRVEFFTPHCDPTVNLYDRMYAVRGGHVEAEWPITARGRSQ